MVAEEILVKFGAQIGELTAAVREAGQVVKAGTDQMQQAYQHLAGASGSAAAATGAATQAISKETQKAAASVQAGVAGMSATIKTGFNGITTGIGQLNTAFMAITSMFAGGALFKHVIDQTAKWASETLSLSRVLGITTEQASVYNVGLRLIGKTSSDLEDASFKLLRQIKANEGALNDMGLKTREAATNGIRPMTELIRDALDLMKEYKEGADRDAAAMYMFGRSAKEVMELQKLNNDVMARAEELAKRYNLEVGDSGVAAARAYKIELNSVKLLFESIQIKIGFELMPLLTQLAGYFNETGPAAASTFGNAIKGIAIAVDGLLTVIRSAVSGLMALASLIPGIGAIEASTWDTYGNGAGSSIEETKTRMESMKGVMELWTKDVGSMFEGLGKRYDMLFAPATPPKITPEKQVSKGTRTFEPPESTPGGVETGAKSGKGSSESSRVQIWRQELDEIEDREESWTEVSKARELEFWIEKLALTKQGSDEYRQIFHITAQLKKQISREETEEERKASQERVKIQETELESRKKTALGALEIEQQNLAFRKELGEISAADEIEGLKSLADRRFEIELQSLQDRLALHDLEAEERAKILERIEELQQKHALRMRQLDNQSVLESKNRWGQILGTVSSAFEKSITGIIMGTTTLKNALSNIFQSILGEFVNLGVRMVVNWASTELAKTTLTKTGEAQRTLIESTGFSGILAKAVSTIAGWLGFETAKTAAVTTGAAARTGVETAAAATSAGLQAAFDVAAVIRNAAVTFSGVFAFMAPFMGPAAVGPAAASMAEVLAVIPMAAAAGGMEVDRDQIVKVHEKEVVLPAVWTERLKTVADTVRNSMSFESMNSMLVTSMNRLSPAVVGPMAQPFSASNPINIQRTIRDDSSPQPSATPASQRTLQLNISAVDARSFEQALERSGSKLSRLIKKSYRDFSLRGTT